MALCVGLVLLLRNKANVELQPCADLKYGVGLEWCGKALMKMVDRMGTYYKRRENVPGVLVKAAGADAM